jgi:uncharacterized protein (TIGR01319 family)
MNAVLLIDFGSTYTKVTAVDVETPALLGCCAAYTTVDTDVGEGLAKALDELKKQTGPIEIHNRYACSSAAGGLRMVACGLVPELTAKAASLASLGAGAKVAKLYSYRLTEDDIEEIFALAPDILLLTGGTDGGNTQCILHNAAMIAEGPGEFPVVVAGNRSCGRQIMRILEHRQAYLCENVMPALDKLNIEPARQKIRDIFMESIVRAKGLSRVSDVLDGILMPTPAAVLAGVELLAKGCEGEPGIGDLVAVDVGGATTDVFSRADGMPRGAGVVYKGLPEPFAKRTVEGDIGMRYSVHGIAEAAGISRVAELAGLSVDVTRRHLDRLASHIDSLPEDPGQKALDAVLAGLAIETASLRHAGALEEVYTAAGRVYIQTGKDLTGVEKVILTGGALLHADNQEKLAVYAMYSDQHPQSLRPKRAELFIDKHYILAAMGLLSGYEPLAALRVLKSGLQK